MTKNDALYGRDRAFIHNLSYTAQPYVGRDTQCAVANLAVNTVFVPANFTISSVNYAAPGFVANTFNRCDNSQNTAVVPKAERHGVFVGLTQEFGDRTSIDVRAFYGQRKTYARGVLASTVTVGAANPYAAQYLPAGLALGGGVVANFAQVSFNLNPVAGLGPQRSDTSIREWGANAELKHDLSDNWQLRGLLNWSESDSRYDLTGISNSRLAAAGSANTLTTAFNPFDVSKNNAALITDLTDSEIAGQAKDHLFNARLIAEGKLLDLPGGDARLAVGYEFIHDKLEQRFQSDIRIGTLATFPLAAYSRDVHAVFGELNLPLIANGNGGALLVVAASGRYDHYSDFGNTFNPKIAASLKPVEWITLRGNWGTSFTAPTPLDQLGSLRNTVSAFPFVAFTRPGDIVPAGSFTVALQGSQPNLQPQKATTWSLGFDIAPPALEGLRASLSYYDVNFKGILRTPTPNAGIFTNFPNNITSNVNGVTAAQLTAFGTLAPGGAAVVSPLIASGTRVYELVDFRVGNFGVLHVKGLDFGLNYKHSTSFGGIDFAVNGIYQLSRKQQVNTGAAVTEDPEYSPFNLQTSLGANIGAFRAQATWSHSQGYNIVPTASVPVQSRVGSFNTVDLFFKYDVSSDSRWFKDLSFTLNVKNVADQDPPVLLRNNPSELGYTNGFTLGRMFIIGVSKKF